MGRKRQRSRAALTDDDEQPVAAVDDDDSGSAQDRDVRSQAGEEREDTEQPKRDLDVWDAFKEEHHEVLEQLPLSLHRQFKLMHELDVHSEAIHADLLASVRRYILLRESLAARTQADRVQLNATVVFASNVDQACDTSSSAVQIDAPESLFGDTTDSHSLPPGSINPDPPKPGETTRELLQHVAQASEEAIRTAEEKVSIAQTAYETVDRHIRLLDQAIREQEAAISLGARLGTHLAPILLPDLVVPRWARPPRVEHSPVPSLSPEPELYVEAPPVLGPPPPRNPPKASKKGKKASKPSEPEKEEISPPDVVGDEEIAGVKTRRAAVRLTIPPQPRSSAPSVPVESGEKRYCYCHQVSFGAMVACDREGCRFEWFHLGCTGLPELPSRRTKFYCRECKPKIAQKGRSRT